MMIFKLKNVVENYIQNRFIYFSKTVSFRTMVCQPVVFSENIVFVSKVNIIKWFYLLRIYGISMYIA